MSDAVQPAPNGTSIFWLVYGQIAAMLGAFSLLVFLTHFFDVGLKGVIRDAFDAWVTYVRPVIGFPLQFIVELLPDKWRFAVPEFAKYYLVVGIVTLASYVRFGLHSRYSFFPRGYVVRVLIALLEPLLAWPYWTIKWLWRGLVGPWPLAGIATFLSPVLYLALLFAANAWLV